jgi:hypothetical protein
VRIERTGRSAVGDHFGWHPSTGPDVDERYGHIFVNNLLTSDVKIDRSLFSVTQPRFLCERLDKPQMKQLDYNVYIRRKVDPGSDPLITWSPVANPDCRIQFDSPAGLNELHAEFSAHSRSYDNYTGSLFKSPELGNYQLMQAFPGSANATQLPGNVMELLKRTKKDGLFPGAYKPNQ